MIEAFPQSGLTLVPESLVREFGPQVRKCAMSPFYLVYEYDEDADVVFVHGLVRQSKAW